LWLRRPHIPFSVKTKLIAPKPPDSVTLERDKEDKERHTLAFVQSTGPSSLALSSGEVPPAYHRHSTDESSVTSENSITVRIEVTDSGPGIRPSDLQDSRLFSPYVKRSTYQS
jgi:signal transduction histidine kinase